MECDEADLTAPTQHDFGCEGNGAPNEFKFNVGKRYRRCCFTIAAAGPNEAFTSRKFETS